LQFSSLVAVAIIYAGFCLLKSRGHQPSEEVSMAERHWAQSILNKMRWTVLNGIGKKTIMVSYKEEFTMGIFKRLRTLTVASVNEEYETLFKSAADAAQQIREKLTKVEGCLQDACEKIHADVKNSGSTHTEASK
jgi:hypothetical protein